MSFRDELKGQTITEKENEYVIWGIPEDKKEEEILYTKAKSEASAKKVMKVLEKNHGCKKVRLQTIDFSTGLDFAGAIK